MRIVLTLLVRDEADVIEANLRHHLALGVDHVVVTDHRSSDGTTEILRRFEADGRLTLVREESDELRQSDWVTRMARLAQIEMQKEEQRVALQRLVDEEKKLQGEVAAYQKKNPQEN